MRGTRRRAVMANFEVHITCRPEDAHRLKSAAFGGWKFSQFDGDPVMGEGHFTYLTCYRNSAYNAQTAMEHKAYMLREVGAEVLRTKIEKIIYDSKTGVNEIEEDFPNF